MSSSCYYLNCLNLEESSKRGKQQQQKQQQQLTRNPYFLLCEQIHCNARQQS